MLNGKEKAAVEFITQGITPHQGGISRDLVGSLNFHSGPKIMRYPSPKRCQQLNGESGLLHNLVVTRRYPTNEASKRDC